MFYLFVETNFLVNISLKQEEHRSAYKLLQIAEQNKIKLCIPNFCISEAYWALAKKHEGQVKYRDKTNEFINETLRGSHSRRDFEKYNQIPTDIDRKIDKEVKMLDTNIVRVLSICELINLNKTIHQKGILYR